MENPLLTLLHPPGSEGLVEWRAVQLKRDGWGVQETRMLYLRPGVSPAELWELNAYGYHLWVGPSLRWRRGAHGRKRDGDLLSTWALWADLDAKGYAGGKGEASERLGEAIPRPSVIVDSGHGYHAYYLLTEPLSLRLPEARAALKAMHQGLADLLGADRGVCNPANMMRVPGSLNVKGIKLPSRPAPVWCELVELRPGLRYDLAELSALLPAREPEPVSESPRRRTRQLQAPTPQPRKRGRPSLGVTKRDLRTIRPWARRLLTEGPSSSPGRYVSRSEADLAAVGAMLAADWPESRILAAFTRGDWRIGERFRELWTLDGDGRALGYLESTIRRALQGSRR